MKDIINWHELSQRLSGNGQNIRPNSIPKKYEKKNCSFAQNSRSLGALAKWQITPKQTQVGIKNNKL